MFFSYIYLWINYAIYEELEAKDIDRAREVYNASLNIIPHKKFTFAKLWLMYAQFEIRQRDVKMARRILGTALGKCPKAKLFRGYIDLEIQLREFNRCRTLYDKFLQFDSENCSAWMKFAELENLLGEKFLLNPFLAEGLASCSPFVDFWLNICQKLKENSKTHLPR